MTFSTHCYRFAPFALAAILLGFVLVGCDSFKGQPQNWTAEVDSEEVFELIDNLSNVDLSALLAEEASGRLNFVWAKDHNVYIEFPIRQEVGLDEVDKVLQGLRLDDPVVYADALAPSWITGPKYERVFFSSGNGYRRFGIARTDDGLMLLCTFIGKIPDISSYMEE